ncbi:MAG: hypothetical protein ACRDAX_08230 [Propionibacteriaceae bacterium]
MTATASAKLSRERVTAIALIITIAIIAGGLLVIKQLQPVSSATSTPALPGEKQQSPNTTVLLESNQCGAAPLPSRNAGGESLAPTSGIFCIATLQMTHAGSPLTHIRADETELKMSDGKTYLGAAGANSSTYFNSEITELSSDNKARIQIAFDVPITAKPTLLTLKIHDGDNIQPLTWNVSSR